MIKDKNIIKDRAVRYVTGTVGLALIAAGVALAINSNLGTSPIASPPYVLALWGGLSVGEWTVCVNLCLVSIQLLLLRSQFKLRYLL